MRVGIAGGGAMGRGIAQVALVAGNEVTLYDSSSTVEVVIQKFLQDSFAKLESKGKITSIESKTMLSRFTFVNHIAGLSKSEILIEAIVEDLAIKRKFFSEVEKSVSNQCILATNTSSFSVTALANACFDPTRVIGLHFFNPAPLMQLVEVIPALQTSKYLAAVLLDLMKEWGKTPVIAKDTPGFIVNKVARPYYSESIRIVEEGLSTYGEIDRIMKLHGGFKMGPFELMDFIGHDINFAVTKSVWEATFFDPRYKPSLTQQRLVEAGYLGRKSGKGFYEYADSHFDIAAQNDVAISLDDIRQVAIFERILFMLINEACDALYWGIASRDDLKLATTKGVNYPKCLIEWGEEIGFTRIKKSLDALYERYKEERYRASQYLSEYSG